MSVEDPGVADAVAAYSVPREEFIAARAALVGRLKAEQQAVRAVAVKGFTKPSAAADAVNRLNRESPEIVARVRELGRSFRAAQGAADRLAIRGLGSQRNTLLRDVVSRIATQTGGNTPSSAAMDEVKQTILAAIADEGAAVAVASGRLCAA